MEKTARKERISAASALHKLFGAGQHNKRDGVFFFIG